MRWLYRIKTSKQLALFGVYHIYHIFKPKKLQSSLKKFASKAQDRASAMTFIASKCPIVKNRSQLVAMAPSYF